jgi:hypothetical protein
VHYVSRGSADGVFEPECRAAMVTKLLHQCPDGEPGECIKVMVVSPDGIFFNQHTCHQADKRPGTWHPIAPSCKDCKVN